MKNFKFKLDKVLDIKIQQEDNLKNSLAILLKKINDENKIIDDLTHKLNYQKQNKTNLSNALEYKNFVQYINFIEEKIKFHTQLLNNLTNEYKKEQLKLIEATKERKSIEKLKEKSYNEYLSNLNKIEQKTNDEFALYNFLRAKGGKI